MTSPDATPATAEPVDPTDADDVDIDFLSADESGVLVGLVTEVYGDTYDAEWVYQADEIARRITDGQLVSTVGRQPDGTAIGHLALMVEHGMATVVHAGVAVVTKAARGHHLFTRLKRFGAQWATSAGYLGIFSEATAAHPFSQRANIDLGATETGFLLGWIPSTVSNNAAEGRSTHRESVALFYLQTNEGPVRPVYAPARHREVVNAIITASGSRGQLAMAPPDTPVPAASEVLVQVREDHNLAIITVTTPGADIREVLELTRDRLMRVDGRDAVYVDLPLENPATEILLDACDDSLTFGFAGVFPNQHVGGDVLRLQSLNDVEIRADDIATASPHGAALLAYVVADLRRTHANL